MLDPADPAHRLDRPNAKSANVRRAGTCDDVTPRDLTSTRIATYVTLPSLRAALWHVARAACGVRRISVSFVQPISDSSDSLTRVSADRKETRRRPREGTKERAERCKEETDRVKCVEKREVKMPSVKSASNADYNRSRNDHRVVEN
ncbi:hypothetical protein G5I_11058 [Acromyrmex echinatior]|uniref:Uncharacterized protein n=1 Tax=Acromyrmex echinatior TaxID=103372 RepID=F4WYK5_ACREC|nr:hypothetical protein G5I_11058 [Acromyrmex echinatior]